MANPQTITVSEYGYAITFKATASYVRDGDGVTVTVKCEISNGRGYYYRAWLGDDLISAETTGTFYRTFTYTFSDARTLSFDMSTMCQQASGYQPVYNYATLTINIPAIATRMYVASGGTIKTSTEIYAVENHTPNRVREIYSVSGGIVRRVT